MRGFWIAFVGIGTAVLYGFVSHGISGSWNAALAFETGAVVVVALWGLRSYAAKEEDEENVEVGGKGGVGEENAGGESRLRAEEEKESKREVEEGSLPSCASIDAGQSETNENHHPSTSTPDFDASPDRPPTPIQDPNFSAGAPAEAPEALWERARGMVHNVIPDFEEDAEYLNLVFSAAEQGHVPALAKLGDYAFRRGAFVEAYFWTKIAKRRLELAGDADPQDQKAIGDMLLNIRREWTAAGQPPEFENAYDSFPEERGELGRAFLRLDGGIEVNQTREYIKFLVEKGNPDAALFAS